MHLSARGGELVKERRVGTFTMGLALLAIGILTLVGVFWKELDLVWVLRLSPAILIFLGIEILVFSFHNSEKLKYDALSIVFAILLICGTLLASICVQAYNSVSENATAQLRWEDEVENALGNAFSGVGEVENFSISPSDRALIFFSEEPVRMNARVTLSASQSGEEFANKVVSALTAMKSATLPNGSVRFSGRGPEDEEFSLYVNLPGGYQMSQSEIFNRVVD